MCNLKTNKQDLGIHHTFEHQVRSIILNQITPGTQANNEKKCSWKRQKEKKTRACWSAGKKFLKLRWKIVSAMKLGMWRAAVESGVWGPICLEFGDISSSFSHAAGRGALALLWTSVWQPSTACQGKKGLGRSKPKSAKSVTVQSNTVKVNRLPTRPQKWWRAQV